VQDDERCLYYEKEEEALEREVHRRTLKIQMVRTALMAAGMDALEA
jgi:hypothetical protein